MEIIAAVIPIIQLIFSALNCKQLNDIISIFGYESELDELHETVSTIDALFRDAEGKQHQLSNVQRNLLEGLKDAVYEAEDLLDEFATLAKQKELLKDGGGLPKKVIDLFTPSKNPSVAYKMSKGIENIKKELDAIAYNRQLSIGIVHHEPIMKINRETSSDDIDYDVGIIGRGGDLEEIVCKLLYSNNQRNDNVSFISIVGIGGVGKTALAQLVFNDKRVEGSFPTRKWTCVSDQDQQELPVKEILCKILGGSHEGKSLDDVKKEFRQQIASQKFLLVLDDVWTENRHQWKKLENILKSGTKGSWIVITTRSQQTANNVSNGDVHELASLSEESSWQLLKKTAMAPDSYEDIGRKIVNVCARNPLAITVIGSLLYHQEKIVWKSFKEFGVAATIEESKKGDIMPILKLSYDHLEAPLKSCFSYCALFPKDFEMKKEVLKSMWMAQGYIVPKMKGQSIEVACEKYFLILLRRCFFQDIKTDETGEIFSVKIHDLMHDLAQDVIGQEIYHAASTISGELDERVRHLSMPCSIAINELSLGKPHLRSYLHVSIDIYEPPNIDGLYVKKLIKNCGSLRALDLNCLGITKLPGSISELLHLRYLSLSNNDGLKVLPESITNLYNLQTLDLRACRKLTKLPKDLNRLVNLRRLDIQACFELKYMPKNMNKLKYLTKLSDYIVGSETSCLSWNEWFNGLEDLKDLNNLYGCLRILIKWPHESVVEKVYTRKNLYLRSKEDLSGLEINFSGYNNVLEYILAFDIGGMENMEDEGAIALMEDLQPPSNLKYLNVMGYTGSRMPLDWACFLNKLVILHLYQCELEYMEIFTSSQEAFLPVLERLVLMYMPKLKGWRKKRGMTEREESSSQLELLPCLSHLKEMILQRCPMLTCIPPCPKLVTLKISGCPKMNKERDQAEEVAFKSAYAPKFRHVTTDNVASLKLWPMEAFQCLEDLVIHDEKVESLRDIAKVFRGCSSSLQSVRISGCPNLWTPVAELDHLTDFKILLREMEDGIAV